MITSDLILHDLHTRHSRYQIGLVKETKGSQNLFDQNLSDPALDHRVKNVL